MRKVVFACAGAAAVAAAAIVAAVAFAGGDPVPTCTTAGQTSSVCRVFTVDWSVGPPQAFEYDAEQVIGDVTINSFSNEVHPTIDIYAYNWGESATTTSVGPGGGGGIGKSEFQDFTIVKLVDQYSPLFATACATGFRFHDIPVVVKTKEGTMTYRLQDAVCTLDKHGASGQKEQLPLEEVSFTYRAIEWIFTPKKGDTLRRCFDREDNHSC